MDSEKIGYKVILKQKEYMKTVIADIINRFGDSIDSIAFTWLVYQVTNSAAWSAIVFGINRIPTIFLQPFAGAIVEGKNKKFIMSVTDIIRGIMVGFIATAFIIGFLNKWLLLIATIIISSAEAFRRPASTALIPKILDKKYYTFGLSLSSSVCNITEMVGFGIAGIIISTFSISAAIYIDMATFLISALIILTIRVKEEKLTKEKINVKDYIRNLKDGFSYLKENKILRYFIILAVFINGILVPFNSLQAPLIKEVLGVGNLMLSVISIGITVGMVIGAASYPYISRKIGSFTLICLGAYSISVYYFSFLIVGKFIHSILFMYIIISVMSIELGIAVALLTSFCSVELVNNIDTDYMARVSAILGAASVAAVPIVSFIVSAFAGFLPTTVLFLMAGLLNVVICIRLCNRRKFYKLTEKVQSPMISSLGATSERESQIGRLKNEEVNENEIGKEIGNQSAC